MNKKSEARELRLYRFFIGFPSKPVRLHGDRRGLVSIASLIRVIGTNFIEVHPRDHGD